MRLRCRDCRALAPGRLDDAVWRNLADEQTGLLYD